MSRKNILKMLAFTHLETAAGFYLFWIGFYTRLIFPVNLMREKIDNFDGYYAWETSFTVPDLILATLMVIGGVMLLRNNASRLAQTILIAASGGCVFLGVLDFTYDIRNGMYSLGHFFSYILLLIGIYLPPFGLVSIWALHKYGPEK